MKIILHIIYPNKINRNKILTNSKLSIKNTIFVNSTKKINTKLKLVKK